MIFRSTSKKPIVIVGNGCREAGAAEVLHAFYKKTKIPVLTTMNAVDLMQDEDKLGFTYAALDRYIRTGEIEDQATKARIDRLNKINAFKLKPIPAYFPAKELV